MGGSRAKQKWQEADLQTVEQWIEQDARTNSHQLAQKLSEQRQVKLSRLRHLLQKRALDGNELVTATEASKTLSKTTQTSRPQYTEVSCTRGLHRPEISG